MPLEKNKKSTAVDSNNVATFAENRQKDRASKTANIDEQKATRPSTPRDGLHDKIQGRRGSSTANAANASKKSSPEQQDDLRQHKIFVPNNMYQMRPPALHKAEKEVRASKDVKPSTTVKSEKQNKASKAAQSVFDDTQSLSQSNLDDSVLTNDRIAPIHEPTRTVPGLRDSYVAPFGDFEDMNDYNTRYNINNALPETRREEVKAERTMQLEEQTQHGFQGQVPRQHSSVAYGHGAAYTSVFDSRSPGMSPETPSRVQSVPPFEHQIHAPGPQRKVNFAQSPEMFSDRNSSFNASAEVERTDTPDHPAPRSNSVQPLLRNTVTRSNSSSVQKKSSNRALQQTSTPHAQSERFHRVLQQHQKVSAPESDMQDSSEDERARPAVETQPQVAIPVQLELMPTVSKKRSYEEVNSLDYSPAELKKKKLSDLQSEPFTHDPQKPPPKARTDNYGNSMSIEQLLTNLNNIDVEGQREIFRTQTDEQWAQTGQWFVNKFQANLEKLMELKVERRKQALKYEDKIKRRQAAIEHQQRGLDKDLQELQQGGQQLVANRKAANGSRVGTPSRGVR